MSEPRCLVLVVQLPPAECSPNARVDRREKARAVKQYRAECFALVRSEMVRERVKPFEKVEISYEFCYAPPRVPDGLCVTFDVDNAIGSMKPFQDSLKDARLLPKGDSHRRVSLGSVRLLTWASEHRGRRYVIVTIREVP